MASSTNGNGSSSNGEANKPTQGNEQPQIQAQVAAQYIKDFSFENPNVERLLNGPGENPNLQLEVNVNAKKVGDDLYESTINLNAHASNKLGTIYQMELDYAGMFRITNIPDEALEPFLLINCPNLIFPFVRRIVADISREGGFPPLLLDPIDFAALFVQRKQAEAEKDQSENLHN